MKRGFEKAPSSSDYEQVADGELLSKHQAGDTQAFAELVQRYRKQVFTFLVRYGVPESARDDLFQEIFFVVHKRSSTYDSSKPLRPWLFTVVINQVRDHFRKMLSEGGGKVIPFKAEHEPRDEQRQGELAVASETAQWLDKELEKLPHDQREATLLHSVKGLTHEEISKIMNAPVSTIKTNVRRARLSLARALTIRNARIAREVGS